jgi:hypothetical protein
MNVYLTNDKGYLRLHYQSKYALGSYPINTPEELVRGIEEICGKGSYCFYHRPSEFPMGHAQAIDFSDYSNYPHLPRLSYWQQGVKTSVIEQCRQIAKEVWGDIPEMRIGWLENQCKTYVD